MKKIAKSIVLALLCFALSWLVVLRVNNVQAPITDAPDIQSEPEEEPPEDVSGLVIISEIMSKNRTTPSNDGDIFDYVELLCCAEDSVDLNGWTFSQNDNIYELSGLTLEPGARTVVYLDRLWNENCFDLKDDAVLTLCGPRGSVACTVDLPVLEKNTVYELQSDGSYSIGLYPSPGYENTREGYIDYQNSLSAPASLIISEVMVYNKTQSIGNLYYDWVELYNASGSDVNLAEYSLSDNTDKSYPLPEINLPSGEYALVLCTTEKVKNASGQTILKFSLGSSNETLYLTKGETIVDYMSLKDILYGYSFGRLLTENGGWYFDSPTPGAENSGGYRYISDSPVASVNGGLFPDTQELSIELSGKGTIYYTLDSSGPTTESTPYTGPIVINSSTVVRAIAVEDGQSPSRSVTYNYIMGVSHDLPVICINSDVTREFSYIYQTSTKKKNVLGNVSFYDGDSCFSNNCAIAMNGGTSLELVKKNVMLKFKGAFGDEEVDYDVFGDGQAGFSKLLLRAGQDYYNTMVRNEVCQDLCSEFTDSVLYQRGRPVVVYINGQYYGLYALKEANDEHLYADRYGVSEDSVTVYGANISESSMKGFLRYLNSCDITSDADYQYLCDNYIDVDSFVDWMVIEGWTGNPDLARGNLKYARSSQGDAKIRIMFFDLDAALSRTGFIYTNIFQPTVSSVISGIANKLMKNPDFRDKFLTRAGEAFTGALSDENVISKIQALSAEMDSEVERDNKRWHVHPYDTWRERVDALEDLMDGYSMIAVNRIISMWKLSDEEARHYFGELLN